MNNPIVKIKQHETGRIRGPANRKAQRGAVQHPGAASAASERQALKTEVKAVCSVQQKLLDAFKSS